MISSTLTVILLTFILPDVVGRDGVAEVEGPNDEGAVVTLPQLLWMGGEARLLRLSVSMRKSQHR